MAAGDDASAGWLYTQQTYDWKGRPRVTTNQDGTTKEASYSGCGCAGGEVVTLTDEGTLDGGVPKRRQQKIYSDVLGRPLKTEVLNWDGAGPNGTGGSVYATTVNIYNARDQIMEVKQYAGPEGSGTFQTTTMTYDGYGRLKTKHLPEQQVDPSNSSSTDHTTWDYYPDDTVQKITDARGSVSNFTYNSRQLTTGITYDPSSGVDDTPDVSFGYDAAGNRTSMTDGLGSVSYNYSQLSQMISETRAINGVGSFTNTYGYSVGGKLTSVTDPFAATISYGYDQAGRLNGLTGTGFGNVTQYATGMQYRAWGSLKRLTLGNSSAPQATLFDYNSRMQVRRQEIRYSNTNALQHSEEYQYNSDGSVQSSQRGTNIQQDRKYGYDPMGRMVQALTAAEARGEAVTMPSEIPFAQNYGYDAFGNLNSRTGKYWGRNAATISDSYVNNRNSAWSYDAEGNLLQQLTRQYTYDAAGQNLTVTEPPRRPNQPSLSVTESYDGDGRRIKLVQNGVTSYQLYSSALGGVLLTKLSAQGNKTLGYVYANGSLLATQSQANGVVSWLQHSPGGNGDWITYSDAIGTVRSVELDPLLTDVGVENPSVTGGVGGDGSSYPNYGDPVGPQTCALNYDVLPCDYVMKVLGREPARSLFLLIKARIGYVRTTHTNTLFDGDSILIDRDYTTVFGEKGEFSGPSVTVAPTAEVLESIESINLVTQWAVSPVPQNSAPFDRSQIKQLVTEALGKGPCADFAKTILDVVSSKKNPTLGGGDLAKIFEALTDEGTLDGGVPKRRQQKIYSDVLARPLKTEVLNWDGAGPNGTGGSVYETTVNIYNARDQIMEVKQYAGPEGSGTFQTTTMTYDGYGRLKTKHVPEQQVDPSNSSSTDHTTWDYYPDDTVQKITDARGSVSNFTYNSRQLTTGITYDPSSGVDDTPDVSFTYDAAGNRTSMTDGSGSVTYQYNQLSRLTSETRQFTGLAGSYSLTYDYTLAGAVKSLTDPTGATINYTFDAVGRTGTVTGTSFAGVTNYASDMQYRAWGDLKGMSYGNTKTLATTFNTRLQPAHFEVPGIMVKDYQYQSDGRLRFSADGLNNKFDRSYGYDQVGRVKEAFSGPLARGQADSSDRPYKMFYQYDTSDNLLGRVGSATWGAPAFAFQNTSTFADNRNTAWSYDADGRLTSGGGIQHTHDAAGRVITVVSNSGDQTQQRVYDASGQATKTEEAVTEDNGFGNMVTTTTTRYTIFSTVTGAAITDLNESGQKTRTLVYRGGQVLAMQDKSDGDAVKWEYRDPGNASYRTTFADGSIDGLRVGEIDPLGANAGGHNPLSVPQHHWPREDLTYPAFSDMISGNCDFMGIATPCEVASRGLLSGAFVFDPTKTSPATAGTVGAMPIYGRFCVTVVAAGKVETQCTIEITGYTNPNPLALSTPQNTERRATTDEYLALRREMAKALQSEKCRKFIDTLISYDFRAPYDSSEDVLALSDYVYNSSNGGVFWRNGKGGIVGNKIWLGPDIRPDLNLMTDAEILMHELIHRIQRPGRSDDSFDRQIRELGIIPVDKKGNPLPFPTGMRDGKKYNDWSGYWDTALRNACFPNLPY